jgi:hypothetical protein
MSESTERIEYRAVYRQPASILDSPDDRQRGYVERVTTYGEDRERIRKDNYALSRAEESLAHIVRWERRVVAVGPWQPVAADRSE